ncbi:peroxidase-related enzyme [Rhizorhabdus argentea]|uniref:peroxidase-related enzyme n=1 Tax=Rhizorhabdus argentea TaxID=1387174 RepID=UPI0030ED9DEA
MTDPKSTLVPEFKSNDPYAWIPGDPAYKLPQEWLESPVPEKHSMRILASYEEAGFSRGGAYMGPAFLDPSYGLLTLAEREFIGVVVSSVNSCVTCLVIHGHLLGSYIGDHGRARRIAINYRSVELSAQERAIADYCVKLTEQPGRMEQADLQKLRDVGISDEKIYYIVEMAAMFNLTNRLTSGYGQRPDDDFMRSIAPSD